MFSVHADFIYFYVWADNETKLFLNVKQFSWMKCDMISLKLLYYLMWIIHLFYVINNEVNKTKAEMFLQRQKTQKNNLTIQKGSIFIKHRHLQSNIKLHKRTKQNKRSLQEKDWVSEWVSVCVRCVFALIQGHFITTTLVPTSNRTKTWIFLVSLPGLFGLSCKSFVHYKLRMCERVSQ